MTGGLSTRYADGITSYSRLVVLVVLAATVVVGAGVALGGAGEQDIGGFDVDSEETNAQEFVRSNYGGDEGVAAQLVVREEGGDVLTRDSLLEGLRLQQDVKANETLNETLSGSGFVGIENVVATAAAYESRSAAGGQPPNASSNQSTTDGEGGPPTAGSGQERTAVPSLAAQIDALESLNESEFQRLLHRVLDPDGSAPGGADPYNFLAKSYEPGETDAEARLTLIAQADDSGENGDPQAAYDAQLAIDDSADERFDDAFVFGQGISDDASSRATGDSFAIITPFALVLIVFVLGITYRDLVDILLAFAGIGVVLVWLQGIMGWLAIPMNVILIAVPFLLIGLSIDYALHVVMRYREARAGILGTGEDDGSQGRSIRGGMTLGFSSVVLALGAATVSTAVGFASNVVSPLPAIRDFAILSAGGIVATFVAFGVFLPALKIEVDGFLENRLGRDRAKNAFGVETGRTNTLLEGLADLSSRVPVVIVVGALLLASVGAYGATTIDTEFNQADFLPQDAPDWAEYLPGPLEPGTYTIAADFEYISDEFQLQGGDGQAQILIRDNATDAALLTAFDDASESVANGSSVQVRPDDRAAVEGPHTAIRDVAAENETFAALVDRNDRDGDGLPDENVSTVYAALFDADRETARQVLSRDETGAVNSARLLVSVQGSESAQTIAADTRAYADKVERDVAGVTAVATGGTVTTAVIQDALLETLIEAFAVTLLVILLFLTGLFWMRYGSLSLGAVVLAPVVVSLAWLLGTMSVLGISFNSETAVITSLAIGLGADYSIHFGERFVDEREKRDTLDSALRSALTGTGGTLLASSATTAAAFGVLAFALSPPLQRFGIVTGLAILFAFFAVVTMLPSLLVLRERGLSRWQSSE
jgi:predicted RND superfamily exporter protein